MLEVEESSCELLQVPPLVSSDSEGEGLDEEKRKGK